MTYNVLFTKTSVKNFKFLKSKIAEGRLSEIYETAESSTTYGPTR